MILTTGLLPGEIHKRVREAAKMIGLRDLLEDQLSQLSVGQQRRVTIARAIVRDPKMFLLEVPRSTWPTFTSSRE
jgi:multiple sugar transport system ATP-binding protein